MSVDLYKIKVQLYNKPRLVKVFEYFTLRFSLFIYYNNILS